MIGLLGNNNGDPNDDIQSRTGERPNNKTNERDVYYTLKTCNQNILMYNIRTPLIVTLVIVIIRKKSHIQRKLFGFDS